MLNSGTVLQDRYEILRVIGHGGMSTVYQAKDVYSGALLAVKDVWRSGETDEQIVEQSLVAEGKMLMQLTNPHLPRIYDIIENSTSFMLVMDYIEGQSLDKVVAQQGPQDWHRVLDWGMQICEVFHYLHSQPTPIIYRDMKPANIIVKPNGQLMMIDFGTARTQKIGIAMNSDTVCIGTAGFAAPEQFGGIGQSDARTDVFCLGATLYNLITGHSPSSAPKGILPLEYWNPALKDVPLASIIYKCTRNDPNERYQSAMELYEHLRLAATGNFKNASEGTSALRKSQWQQQELRGRGMVTNGLSSLLQGSKGNSAKISNVPKPEQVVTYQVQPANQPVYKEKLPLAEQLSSAGMPQGEMWKKLILLGSGVAATFAFLAILFIAFEQKLPAIISLIAALGGVAITAVAAVLRLKE